MLRVIGNAGSIGVIVGLCLIGQPLGGAILQCPLSRRGEIGVGASLGDRWGGVSGASGGDLGGGFNRGSRVVSYRIPYGKGWELLW